MRARMSHMSVTLRMMFEKLVEEGECPLDVIAGAILTRPRTTGHSQLTERHIAACAHPRETSRCGPCLPPVGWWRHESGYHSKPWPEDVHHTPRVVGWIPVDGRVRGYPVFDIDRPGEEPPRHVLLREDAATFCCDCRRVVHASVLQRDVRDPSQRVLSEATFQHQTWRIVRLHACPRCERSRIQDDGEHFCDY